MTDRIEASQHTWNILIDLAKKRQTITYSELGKRIGYTALNTSNVLSLLQNHCIWLNIPPITSLVVNKQTGVPGYRYQIRYGSHLVDRNKTFDFDWTALSEGKQYRYNPKYE